MTSLMTTHYHVFLHAISLVSYHQGLSFFYVKYRVTKRSTHTHTGEQKRFSILLAHSFNACESQGWGKLKPGAWNCVQVSHMAWVQVHEIFFTASPSTLVGSRTGTGAAAQHHSLCHNIRFCLRLQLASQWPGCSTAACTS